MSAHTPGPWSTKRSGSRHAVKAGSLIVASAAPLLFEGEQEANANLIAAAPDMLHELRAAAAQIEALGGDARTQRAAIAKATGEAA